MRGVVERFTRPGERQHYFRLTEDPLGRKFEQLPQHVRRWQAIVIDARKALPDEMSEAKDRLAEVEDICEFALETAESNLRAWRERRRKKTRN